MLLSSRSKVTWSIAELMLVAQRSTRLYNRHSFSVSLRDCRKNYSWHIYTTLQVPLLTSYNWIMVYINRYLGLMTNFIRLINLTKYRCASRLRRKKSLRHSVDKHLATICPFYKLKVQLLSKLLQCSTHQWTAWPATGCGLAGFQAVTSVTHFDVQVVVLQKINIISSSRVTR